MLSQHYRNILTFVPCRVKLSVIIEFYKCSNVAYTWCS